MDRMSQIAFAAAISLTAALFADSGGTVAWTDGFSRAPTPPKTNQDFYGDSTEDSSISDQYTDHAGWTGSLVYLGDAEGVLQVGSSKDYRFGTFVTPPLPSVTGDVSLVVSMGSHKYGPSGGGGIVPVSLLRGGVTNSVGSVELASGTNFCDYAFSPGSILPGDRLIIHSVTNRSDTRVMLDSVSLLVGGPGGGGNDVVTDCTAWNMAGDVYSRDFGNLAGLGNNSPFSAFLLLLPEWQACANSDSVTNVKENAGTTQYGGFYVYDTASLSVGSMATESASFAYGFAHSNGTEWVATNVAVSFDARQLNNKNPAVNTLRFEYLVTNALVSVVAEGDWRTVPELCWTMPLTTDSAYSFAETNLEASIDLSVKSGEHVLYRWVDVNEQGRDTCSAIDNVLLSYSFRKRAPGLFIYLR